MSRLDRIVLDPAVCHGQPTVRGLRYPVENLLELLSSGMTIEDVLADYPDLERDDLLATRVRRPRLGSSQSGSTRRGAKFLIDAQLPARLARFLTTSGHDALHTLDLPDGNRTTDAQIAEIADGSDRVVVTKDRDFEIATPYRTFPVMSEHLA